MGVTILEAARRNDIHIPTLCDDPRLEPHGGCRLCLVQVKGMPRPVTACTTPATDGMDVETSNELIERQRRTIVELLLSDHPERLHGLRAGRGLYTPGTGLLLRPPCEPLLGPAAPVHQKGHEPLYRTGHGEVRPVRQVRPGLRRDPGPRSDRHLRQGIHRQGDAGLRKGPGLRILRPVRQHLPDRRAHLQAGPGQGQGKGREGSRDHLLLLRMRMQPHPARLQE